jgi:RNase P subunit RPR2
MTQTITANYGKHTNVICKACHQRKIFVGGPTTVTVDNGERYLNLKCPSATCGQVRRYSEEELELHGSFSTHPPNASETVAPRSTTVTFPSPRPLA